MRFLLTAKVDNFKIHQQNIILKLFNQPHFPVRGYRKEAHSVQTFMQK